MWIHVCWQNVSTRTPKKKTEYDWPPTYSSLDSVKCVMGYTQRFTTIEHKVAPRSAWVQSLWSRLWVFSLCAVFWHVKPACRHAWLLQLFVVFYSANMSCNWPPLSNCLSSCLFFPLGLCLYLSTFLSLIFSLSLSSPSLSLQFVLSMSNNSSTLVSSLCPIFLSPGVFLSKEQRSPRLWYLHFDLIRPRDLPHALWKYYYPPNSQKFKQNTNCSGFYSGLYPSQRLP